MNKFGRGFVFYTLVLAVLAADEIKSMPESHHTSTTTKWKEPISTAKEKISTTLADTKPSTTPPIWQRTTTLTNAKPSTTSSNLKQPVTITTTNWKTPTSPTSSKKTTSPTKWNQSSTTNPSNTRIFSASLNNGAVAFASVSGIDSRNGRVSSINNLKLYPSSDSSVKTDEKGNYIFKTVNGKPMPITITKQGDGVSGIIQILPGSVSVASSSSSSSKSGPAAAVSGSNPWPPFRTPMINDFYIPPIPSFPTIPDSLFTSSIPDPSFDRRFPDPFTFVRFPRPVMSRIEDPWYNQPRYKQSEFKQNRAQPWYYPAFNPFLNFW